MKKSAKSGSALDTLRFVSDCISIPRRGKNVDAFGNTFKPADRSGFAPLGVAGLICHRDITNRRNGYEIMRITSRSLLVAALIIFF
jgi:hypothetical protein